MDDPSDLEATIGRSFESRSTRLDPSAGDLDDVLTRVERRRSRRRSVAVVGSLAVIGVGVFGIVALGDRGEDPGPVASPGSEAAAVTVDQMVPARAAWRCHDQLEYWGVAGDEVYFASCEQTTIDGGIEVLDQPAPTTPSDEQPPATVPGSTEIIAALPSVPVASVPSGDDSISPEEQLYVVVDGDSLAGIAQAFGIDMQALITYNEWPEGRDHPIFPGDIIAIPPGAFIPGGLGTEHPTPTSTTTTTTVG